MKDLTEEEAVWLTSQLKADQDKTFARWVTDLVELFNGRAWKAMHYSSWEEYLAAEGLYVPKAFKKPVERGAAVRVADSLMVAEDGGKATQRELAAMFGVSQRQISDDLRRNSATGDQLLDPLDPETRAVVERKASSLPSLNQDEMVKIYRPWAHAEHDIKMGLAVYQTTYEKENWGANELDSLKAHVALWRQLAEEGEKIYQEIVDNQLLNMMKGDEQ